MWRTIRSCIIFTLPASCIRHTHTLLNIIIALRGTPRLLNTQLNVGSCCIAMTGGVRLSPMNPPDYGLIAHGGHMIVDGVVIEGIHHKTTGD